MKALTIVIFCVALSASAISADLPGALFFDDFSGDLSAWDLENAQYWSIHDGWLDVDVPDVDYTFAKAFAGSMEWTDYRFEYDLMGVKNSAKICYFRYHDETKGYFLNVRGPVGPENDPGALRLFELNGLNKWPHGSWTLLKKVPFITQLGTTYHITIDVIGPEIVVYVDGIERLRYTDPVTPVLDGRIGFAGFTGANFNHGNHVRWDNVAVSSLVPVKARGTTWGSLKSRYNGSEE